MTWLKISNPSKHWLFRHRVQKKYTHPKQDLNPIPQITLADVPPGRSARVKNFLPNLTRGRRTRLQAYGLYPGHRIHVVQHSPVTVIRFDHAELALERELAKGIEVTDIS